MKKIPNIKKRAQIEMPFGWMFAVLIGAVILFLTIYGVTKFVKQSTYEEQTIGAKEFGILLNPLETGFEEMSSTSLTRPVDTKVYLNCKNTGYFGKQTIQLSEMSFKKWSPVGLESSFNNKYIFSKAQIQGKNFYVFSRVFEYPFKATDVIYLTSSQDKYCFDFKDADYPEHIKEEIEQMNQTNLAPTCKNKTGYTSICFGGEKCDININYEQGYLEKNKTLFYFTNDALMYGAIFSDKNIYDCQVQRLSKRVSELSKLYREKSILMNQRNCNSDLGVELDILEKSLENIRDSNDFIQTKELVENIKQKNENTNCRLW